jgi:outer membrane protein assembly factor BamB
MRADGSGKIVWETKDRVYVPSLLERDGHLFGVLDAGVAVCWKSDTGQEQWKKRLGGEFSASPVLVGDRIYATNESGDTFVYRADPRKFEQIAVNKLVDQAMSSMTICGSRVYLRVVGQVDGRRQEMLYCLANRK